MRYTFDCLPVKSDAWTMGHELRYPPPLRPFVRRIQFRGSISSTAQQIESVGLVIDVDLLGRTNLRGFVLGTNQTVHQLDDLSAGGSRSPLAVSADDIDGTVWVTETEIRHPEDGVDRVVATVDCEQITVRQKLPGATARQIVFLFAGSSQPWGIRQQRTVSFDGSATVKHHTSDFELDPRLPLSFRIMDHYLYDKATEEPHNLTDRCPSITASTNRSVTEFPDDQFERAATEAVEDYAILVSFLSRTRRMWHTRVSLSRDGIQTTYRRAPMLPEAALDHRDSPVLPEQHQEFLRSTFLGLRQLRKDGFEPALTFSLIAAANQSDTPEARFTNYFLALESLRDAHERRYGGDTLLGASAFKRIGARIREVLKEEAASTPDLTAEALENMRAKVAELNRPSLAASLKRLLEFHRTGWEDLYPPSRTPKQPLFIALRNHLLHQGKVHSSRALWYETIRLQGVVERLLLRVLGWNDLRSAPMGRYTYALVTKVGDSSDAPSTS